MNPFNFMSRNPENNPDPELRPSTHQQNNNDNSSNSSNSLNSSDNNNTGNDNNTSAADFQKNMNSNSNNQNNNQNNTSDKTNLWDSNYTESNNSNNSNEPKTVYVKDAGQDDPEKQLNSFIQSLNLTNGVDVGQIGQDLQDGKTESLEQAFASVANNTFRSALTQMNRLMHDKFSQFKDEAVNASTTVINSNMAVQEMQTRLPFTKDANFEPIAKAVLAQYMKQPNMTLGSAIQKTGDYFKQLSSNVHQSFNNLPPDAFPGSGNFNSNTNNSNNSNQSNNSKEIDFVELLTQS